jgi:hypothetical protein
MSTQAIMQAHTGAQPLARDHTGGSRRRQAAARSELERSDVAAPAYNRGGTIVAASACLAFYAIAAIHYAIVTIQHVIASGTWN